MSNFDFLALITTLASLLQSEPIKVFLNLRIDEGTFVQFAIGISACGAFLFYAWAEIVEKYYKARVKILSFQQEYERAKKKLLEQRTEKSDQRQ